MAFELRLPAVAGMWVSILLKPLHRDGTCITPEWPFSSLCFDYSAFLNLGYSVATTRCRTAMSHWSPVFGAPGSPCGASSSAADGDGLHLACSACCRREPKHQQPRRALHRQILQVAPTRPAPEKSSPRGQRESHRGPPARAARNTVARRSGVTTSESPDRSNSPRLVQSVRSRTTHRTSRCQISSSGFVASAAAMSPYRKNCRFRIGLARSAAQGRRRSGVLRLMR